MVGQYPGAVSSYERGGTYDNTLENSLDGDMTKLSLVLDHEMRCCMP
jgi:hypothetical protein